MLPDPPQTSKQTYKQTSVGLYSVVTEVSYSNEQNASQLPYSLALNEITTIEMTRTKPNKRKYDKSKPQEGQEVNKKKRKHDQENDEKPPKKMKEEAPPPKKMKGQRQPKHVDIAQKIKKFQCTDCQEQFTSWAECLGHLEDQKHGGPIDTTQEKVKMMGICRIVEAFIKKPKATATGEAPQPRFKCPDCELTETPMRFHQWSECFAHLKQVCYPSTNTYILLTHTIN